MMSPRKAFVVSTVSCCLVVVTSAMAQAPGAPTTTRPAEVEDRADEILRKMSAYLGSAKEYSFEITNMVDHVLDNGQKIQLSDRSQCRVRRPDRMTVRLSGDTRDETFWYNGKTLTLCNARSGEYGSMDVPATIEQMLDDLATHYGMVVPLAELFFADPYKAVIGNVVKGTYLGLHQVQGVQCHHLAFRQALVDWQIWIEDGDKPLPRKVVITYREVPGQPQYVAFLDNWNLAPKFEDDVFAAKIPPNLKKVDLGPALLQRSR